MRGILLLFVVVSTLVLAPVFLGAQKPQDEVSPTSPPLKQGAEYRFDFGSSSLQGDLLQQPTGDWAVVGKLKDGKNIGDEVWVNLRAVHSIRISKKK